MTKSDFRAAKSQRDSEKLKLQVYALEQILTPSGLVGSTVDDTPDPTVIDVPAYDLDLNSDPAWVTTPADPLQSSGSGTGSSPLLDTAMPLPDMNPVEYADLDVICFADEVPSFGPGAFVVGASGQVSVNFLFDGGAFQGQVGIFSLSGMEFLEPGSDAFIQMAIDRAMTGTELGHVIITDASEGARFSGILGAETRDYNAGDYLDVKSFTMRPGDTFGFILVPNGELSDFQESQSFNGNNRPLFSLPTLNPAGASQAVQLVDVTGDGNTFAFEDLRLDRESDRDYNDLIFQIRGATGQATLMDDVVNPARDWRTTDLGQTLLNYAAPYVDADLGVSPIVSWPVVDPVNQPLIGIIDTGFSGNNSDLDYTNLTLGLDRVGSDTYPLLAPGEGDEHGTHVLGLIAAQQNNGIGIDGINDQAPIWLGRAIGSGQWADSLVEFVEHFRDTNQPNAVVNLSLDLTQVNPDGSIVTRYELTPAERAAIDYARQHNILLVVAAGNDGGLMSALGQASQEFDNIITVGAADRVYQGFANASAYAQADYSSYGMGLDILAPGGTNQNPVLSTVGNGVGAMAGTSVATAQVTGAISQIWAANPQLSYRQIIDILKLTATDLQTPGWDPQTGAGLLNVAAALSLAKVVTPQGLIDDLPTLIPDTWSGDGIAIPGERAVATPFMGKYYEWTPYTVRGGDTLSGIAARTLGDGSSAYWNFIYNQNRNTISNPNLIFPGQVILVPYEVSGGPPGGNPPGGPTPVPIDPSSPNYRNGRLNPYAYSPALIGQCTWYAYGRMLETGLMPPGAISRAMFRSHAYLWERNARDLGLPVTSTPTPGARGLVIWPPGVQGSHRLYGHVAFLEEVLPNGSIRISQSNWAGNKSPHQRVLTPSQYAGLRFVQLENANVGIPTGPLPGQPGSSRAYTIRPGDTLWAIAQRYLGNGNLWTQIMQTPTGGTFTPAQARQLQVGQVVYLPVSYNSVSIPPMPVPNPPRPTPIQIPGSGSLSSYFTIDQSGMNREGEDWDHGRGNSPSFWDTFTAAFERDQLLKAVAAGTVVKGGNPIVTLPFYENFVNGSWADQNVTLASNHPLAQEARNHPSFKWLFEQARDALIAGINRVLSQQISEGTIGNMARFQSLLDAVNLQSNLQAFAFADGNLHVIINGSQKRQIGLSNFSFNFDAIARKINWQGTFRYTISDDFGFDSNDANASGAVGLVNKPAYSLQGKGIAKPYSIDLLVEDGISGTVNV